FQRAAGLAEAAQLDRPDPLAEQLVAQILAQPLADVRPIGGEIEGLLFGHVPIRCFAFGRQRPASMWSHPHHLCCPLSPRASVPLRQPNRWTKSPPTALTPRGTRVVRSSLRLWRPGLIVPTAPRYERLARSRKPAVLKNVKYTGLTHP